MAMLRAYTKMAMEKTYPDSFAKSVHFALRMNGAAGETELNQGYGVLYAKALIREDDTLEERGAMRPVICRAEDGWAVLAELVDCHGQPDSQERLLLWRTTDFVDFDEQRLVSREEAAALLACASDTIDVPEEIARGILNRWVPLQSTRVDAPRQLTVDSPDALKALTARVTYSDGSVDDKPIRWNEAALKGLRSGDTAHLRGVIDAISPEFPLAVGYADPVIFQWQGAWYLLATNDNVNDIGLFIRKADTVRGLFGDKAVESVILAPDAEKRFVQTFWAPEFHVIGAHAYILFAVSGEQWGPQCHITRLKPGCDPICLDSWETPIRVRRPDGSMLTEDGITLDMTYFRAGDQPYLVWSYRRYIGTPKDTGSMLYIAKADDTTPWVLASEPVLLSRPLYGWENTCGTINNEGPYALCQNGKVYLGYSGGDACGYFYVVGYLTADAHRDLTDPLAWRKLPSPMLASTFVEGIQGPGHHSFFQDEDNRWMIAYHAQEREKHFCRCSTYHRVHFAASGLPLLNVTGDRDLLPTLKEVAIFVTMR